MPYDKVTVFVYHHFYLFQNNTPDNFLPHVGKNKYIMPRI